MGPSTGLSIRPLGVIRQSICDLEDAPNELSNSSVWKRLEAGRWVEPLVQEEFLLCDIQRRYPYVHWKHLLAGVAEW
jgi:hypothetical protein